MLERPRRTGLLALKSKVQIRGLGAIDKRTAGARALLTWKKTLIADLGSETAVTAAQRGLIGMPLPTSEGGPAELGLTSMFERSAADSQSARGS